MRIAKEKGAKCYLPPAMIVGFLAARGIEELVVAFRGLDFVEQEFHC